MDPKFFRKYADLIESAENNKPVLTEGMLNDIKTQAMALFNKAKSMPGFPQAYQKAKTMTPQVQAILKKSKSGPEAMERIQQLAKAPANENAFSQAAGVAAGAVGGIGAVATPFSSICAKLLDPLLTSAQATTFALPMLATSIALIGLGMLLSIFTKGNIPGTDPDSAAYQNPNNKPMQEAELDEVVRVQGIDPRTGKLYDPQTQDQRNELARIANLGRWKDKHRIGGLKPGSQGSANQLRISPDRISIAGSDNPGTQPGTRVTNKPAKGFMGTSLGAARPANVGKGK